MAEIPYFFETPIPKYFRENGWYTSQNSVLFLVWAFSKCSLEKRTIVHDSKEITIQPFEFITGRGKSSADSLLTPDAFRHQLKLFLNAGLLKNTPNSTPNRFTCYRWMTERFCKTNPQLKHQLSANCTPTEHPQSIRKKRRSKEDHPSIPSDQDDGMIDDSSSKLKENEEIGTSPHQVPIRHNIYYQEPTPSKTNHEVIPGIFLTQTELDACIKLKGSLEKVKQDIAAIMNDKKRKFEIRDWPNTLANWKIPNKAKVVIEDNIAYADKLCKAFPEFINGNGWRCYIYTDNTKDQKGLLFEPQSSYLQAVFVSLIDGEFKQKCFNTLKEKKMPAGKTAA